MAELSDATKAVIDHAVSDNAELNHYRNVIPALREALEALLVRHLDPFGNASDNETWNPEDETEVQQARAALALSPEATAQGGDEGSADHG